MISYVLTCLCGALALRSVVTTFGWLRPESVIDRPLIFHGKTSFFLRFSTVGFLVILGSALFVGWRFSRWSGLLLTPVEIFFGSQVLDFLIARLFSPRLQFSMLLSPIGHLYVLPYLFLALTIFGRF